MADPIQGIRSASELQARLEQTERWIKQNPWYGGDEQFYELRSQAALLRWVLGAEDAAIPEGRVKLSLQSPVLPQEHKPEEGSQGGKK